MTRRANDLNGRRGEFYPKPQTLHSSFHFLFYYPYIVPESPQNRQVMLKMSGQDAKKEWAHILQSEDCGTPFSSGPLQCALHCGDGRQSGLRENRHTIRWQDGVQDFCCCRANLSTESSPLQCQSNYKPCSRLQH